MEENNNIQQEDINTQQPDTFEEKLIRLRTEWSNEVENLNAELKDLASLDSLLNVVYTKRQTAVDVYYATISVLNKQMREYKKQYANIYNNLKLGQNGIRYTNEQSINVQCEAQLSDQLAIINELKTFTDFMWETVKSIDGIQYAISNKIKIYELMHSVKF
jgi:hypothetical protein